MMATEKRLLIDLQGVNMEEVDTSDCTDVEDIISAVISYLSEQPVVDAVEVVHGRTGPSYMDEYFGEWKDCLECGTDNIWPSNYCRNCGAKMDAERRTDGR